MYLYIGKTFFLTIKSYSRFISQPKQTQPKISSTKSVKPFLQDIRRVHKSKKVGVFSTFIFSSEFSIFAMKIKKNIYQFSKHEKG